MVLDRSIARLHEGRVQKILSRLRAEKVVIPEAFVLARYANTAAYGKFNTQQESEHIVKLYKEYVMEKKAPTQPEVGTVEEQEDKLAGYELRLKREEAELAVTEEWLSTQRQRLTDTEQLIAHARNLLGKTKLTEAIALVDKVATEAPKGSDAANDIDALARRLMLRNVNQVFKDMAFESPFARASGKPDIGAATTTALASMTTSVGAGQPRQAKPSGAPVPKPGDKVRMVKAWYPGGKPFVGAVLTVGRVSFDHGGHYIYCKELKGDSHRWEDGWFEPVGDLRVGDKVQLDPDRTCFTACEDTGVLTVSAVEASKYGTYIKVAEHEGIHTGHNYDARAFKYA